MDWFLKTAASHDRDDPRALERFLAHLHSVAAATESKSEPFVYQRLVRDEKTGEMSMKTMPTVATTERLRPATAAMMNRLVPIPLHQQVRQRNPNISIEEELGRELTDHEQACVVRTPSRINTCSSPSPPPRILSAQDSSLDA